MAIKQADNSRFFLMMDDIPSRGLLTRVNCTSLDTPKEDLKLNQKMLGYPITIIRLLYPCTPCLAGCCCSTQGRALNNNINIITPPTTCIAL